MKNILKTICLLFLTINLSCNAQIVPLKSLDYPNGAYLKDIDNEFPFWMDIWEGTANNKKYTFTLVKFTQHKMDFSEDNFIYVDAIMCKLKVIDLSTNTIIHDESSFTEYDDFIISGNLIMNSIFYFRLFDKENHCNNSADFTLEKDLNNRNQIIYKSFKYDGYDYWDCPYANQEDIPMFLPKVDLVLTRQ